MCIYIYIKIQGLLNTLDHSYDLKEKTYIVRLHNWVVVSTPSEKYESIGMIIPNIWKHKKCYKPPMR